MLAKKVPKCLEHNTLGRVPVTWWFASPPTTGVAAIFADDGVLTLASRVGKFEKPMGCELFHDIGAA